MIPASSTSDMLGEPLHRLTVQQYERMVESGILGPDDRVELLEGLLLKKMTKKPPHRIATHRARQHLAERIPRGWYVDTQEPIVTADSEPEPDVAVIRGTTEDYADANPGAEHVGLVVEVADVTLLRDRRLKARIYARASIPHYWIVNLAEHVVEAYSEPSGATASPSYGRQVSYHEGEELDLVLDGTKVARVQVNELLPKKK